MTKVRDVIIGIIFWKIIVFLLIFFAFVLLPFNKDAFKGNFLYPQKQGVNIFSAFKTWDAQHYLYLSEIGYGRGQVSNSFYPLYPLLIKAVNTVLNNSFLSAIILSNIFSFAGLVGFYLFTKAFLDKNIALLSLILFLSFPTAFYFNLIYTESLFMLLSMLFFLTLYKKRYFFASLFAFLLPLTRSFGIFIFVPFLIYIWQDRNKKPIKINVATFNKPIKLHFYPQYLLLLFPVVGLFADFLYMEISTGDFLAHVHSAQQFFVGKRGIEWLANPVSYFTNFFSRNLTLHGINNSILDRIFFFCFLLSSSIVYKKTDKPMFYYYLLLGFSPLMGSYMSFMRFLLLAFPLYIALSSFIISKKLYFLGFLIFLIFFCLQLLFIILHSLNYWVS